MVERNTIVSSVNNDTSCLSILVMETGWEPIKFLLDPPLIGLVNMCCDIASKDHMESKQWRDLFHEFHGPNLDRRNLKADKLPDLGVELPDSYSTTEYTPSRPLLQTSAGHYSSPRGPILNSSAAPHARRLRLPSPSPMIRSPKTFFCQCQNCCGKQFIRCSAMTNFGSP